MYGLVKEVIRVANWLALNHLNDAWIKKIDFLPFLYHTRSRAVDHVAGVSLHEIDHPCRRTLGPIV